MQPEMGYEQHPFSNALMKYPHVDFFNPKN
jgi:hypothetical protein